MINKQWSMINNMYFSNIKLYIVILSSNNEINTWVKLKQNQDQQKERKLHRFGISAIVKDLIIILSNNERDYSAVIITLLNFFLS